MYLLIFGYLMITAKGLQIWELNQEITVPTYSPITTTITTTPKIKIVNPSCTCVPYYQCVHEVTTKTPENEASFRPELDEEQCEDSLQVCCKSPKGSKPQPDSTRVKGCGYRNPKGVGPSLKVRPTETEFGEIPWIVAVLNSRNSSYLGAGVLISPEVVMTGAHIAHKFTADSLKIRAGEWNTQSVNEFYDHQEREVKEVYLHEEFNKKKLRENIALLRLQQPVQLSEHINVICLPDQGEVFDNYTNCMSNGWGKDLFGREGSYAVILKKQESNIVPHEECNKLLKKTRLGSRFVLHDSFLCAQENEEYDTCRGDGGAPLACPIGNDRYKLTGLVAWGIGCGQKDVPAVYTNVPRYRHWVDNKMADWGLEATFKI